MSKSAYKNGGDVYESGASGGSGEINTSSNSGTGEGLALPKVGTDLPFKSLKAGTNVSLTSDATSVTVNASASGGLPDPGVNGIVTRTALNTDVARSLEGSVNQIDISNPDGVAGNPKISISADPAIAGVKRINIPRGTNAQRPTPTIGDIRFNTTSSFFECYNGSEWLPLYKLVAGTNITLTPTGNQLKIDASGGGGVSAQDLFIELSNAGNVSGSSFALSKHSLTATNNFLPTIRTPPTVYRYQNVDPIVMPYNWKLEDLAIRVGRMSVVGGTVDPNVRLNVKIIRQDNLAQTELANFQVPVDHTKVDIYNSQGIEYDTPIFYTPGTSLTGSAGDMIGIIYDLVVLSGNTTDIDDVLVSNLVSHFSKV